MTFNRNINYFERGGDGGELNSPASPDLVELIPELLDRMISLGELASEIKRTLRSNGHRAEKLEEIRGHLKRQAYR